MIKRHALQELKALLGEFPAVAILGPRQIGKTTLAHALARTRPRQTVVYLDLELPSDLAKLSDAEAFLEGHADKLVILDEIQRAPDLFTVLRGVVDRNRRAGHRVGQFLLLGSASGDLLRQSAESLAGRLAYLELTPLQAAELAKPSGAALERLWLRGGFPQSYLARSDAASMRWRQQFITTYLERDIPQLGPRIPATTLRRLWTMLAHEQGQLLNAAKLASALGLSGQTIARYLDLLCDLMLVRRLPPWAENVGKRMVKAPKVYVRDSGIVHALLGLDHRDAVLAHPVAGDSWEGWVLENLLAVTPAGSSAWFYRTSAGAEVDVVLELPRRRWAIEIKRSRAPTLSPGFFRGCEDLSVAKAFVVYSGTDSFPVRGEVTAVSLPDLLERIAAL